MFGTCRTRTATRSDRAFMLGVIVSTTLAMGSACRAGLSYSLTDLGTLPGWPSAFPAAVNDAGQVTGNDLSSMPYQTAFLYSGGALQDLGNLGRGASAGLGINNSGQVVGFAGTQGSNEHAFLYSNGTTVDLTPSSSGRSAATGINNQGQAVGYVSVTNSPLQTHAALFANGNVQDLGALISGGTSSANAINASGEIVGQSTYTSNDVEHAFAYINGAMKDLGTLGGPNDASDARAINASGQIVGNGVTATGGHAFLYSNGVMQDLGGLPGAGNGSATGINDTGTIVGTSVFGTGQFSAWVDTGGTIYDLNNLLINGQGYHLDQATGINNSGQIVSFARTTSGGERAVLLTPTAVPIPPALWTISAALPMLLLMPKRKPESRRAVSNPAR